MKQISLKKKTGFKTHYDLIFREKTTKGSSMTSVSLVFGELEDLHFKVEQELRK